MLPTLLLVRQLWNKYKVKFVLWLLGIIYQQFHWIKIEQLFWRKRKINYFFKMNRKNKLISLDNLNILNSGLEPFQIIWDFLSHTFPRYHCSMDNCEWHHSTYPTLMEGEFHNKRMERKQEEECYKWKR